MQDPQAGRLLHAILDPFAPARDLFRRPAEAQQPSDLGKQPSIARQPRLAAGQASDGRSLLRCRLRQIARSTATSLDLTRDRARGTAQLTRDRPNTPSVAPPHLDHRAVNHRRTPSAICHDSTVNLSENRWCSLRDLNPPHQRAFELRTFLDATLKNSRQTQQDEATKVLFKHSVLPTHHLICELKKMLSL